MMKFAVLACALLVTLVYPAASLSAQSDPQSAETAAASAIESRSEQIVAFLNDEIPPEEVFSDGFLTALPPAQIKAFAKSLTDQFGRAVAVEFLEPDTGTRSALHVRFERGIAMGGIAIDPAAENAVSELIFRSIEPIAAAGDSAQQIAADLAALPGTVSAYFGPVDGSAPVLSLNPDTQLGLGSTFKFYVLAALGKQVALGTRAWDDIEPLQAKSYPSGVMQGFTQGSPATLYTYASLMMAISDNTATDQLIKLLGRGTVFETMKATGHSAPGLSAPFMTTRELFLLKGGDPARLAAYADAAPAERLAILETIEINPPSQGQIFQAFSGKPVRIDVEWLASANDLRGLFRYMRASADPQTFDIMGINKGMPDEYLSNWSYTGHKGGSEPGVRNLTWLLTDAEGADHVLTLGWNNPDEDVSTEKLLGFAKRLLTLP